MLKFILLFVLPITTYASGSFNGGGDSLVCFEENYFRDVVYPNWKKGKYIRLSSEDKKYIEKVRFLDLVLAERSDYIPPDFGDMSWREIVEDRIEKISRHSYFADLLRHAQRKLDGNWIRVDNLREIDDEPFPMDDEFDNCKPVQIAFQTVDPDGSASLRYSPFLAGELTETDRAALEIHELLRYIHFVYSEIYNASLSTFKIVKMVKYIFSAGLDKDSAEEVNRQLGEENLITKGDQAWNEILSRKYPTSIRRHGVLDQRNKIKELVGKEYIHSFDTPKNVAEFQLIFLHTYGADRSFEGRLFVNDHFVTNLFADQASDAHDSNSIMYKVPVEFIRQGKSNTIKITSFEGNSFELGLLHMRSICPGQCRIPEDWDIIPNSWLSRTEEGWRSLAFEKLHRWINRKHKSRQN